MSNRISGMVVSILVLVAVILGCKFGKNANTNTSNNNSNTTASAPKKPDADGVIELAAPTDGADGA